jgi:hypothetical protein
MNRTAKSVNALFLVTASILRPPLATWLSVRPTRQENIDGINGPFMSYWVRFEEVEISTKVSAVALELANSKASLRYLRLHVRELVGQK